MKDLKHGFALGLVHLGERCLHHFSIVGAAVVQELRQPEGCVPKKDLGILEALVEVGNAELELVGYVLNFL